MRRAAALACLLAAGLALGCRVQQPDEARQPAPEFSLPDLDGESVSLASLRGKPVVLDFWATWCTPCQFQIPVLNEFYLRHAGRVEVVGVAVDAGGRDVVAPFAAEQGIRYRVLIGDEGLAQRFGAIGYPTLYVLRADGTIASTHMGLVEPAELEKALAAAERGERRAG